MAKRSVNIWDVPADFQKISKILHNFDRRRKVYQSELDEHFPYGPATTLKRGMFGGADLLNPPAEWFKNRRTKASLLASIYADVADAMHYGTIIHPNLAFEHQTLEAFAMFQLIRRGRFIWQPLKDIPRPLITTARADATASEDEDRKRQGRHYRRSGRAERINSTARHYMGYWPQRGRYLVTVQPIEKFNIQQLRAISIVVQNAFENQC